MAQLPKLDPTAHDFTTHKCTTTSSANLSPLFYSNTH